MSLAKNSEGNHSQMRLLVVGGKEEDVNYLCGLLKRLGDDDLSLDRARSIPAALSLLGQTTYDLVLCDYRSGDGLALRFLHEFRGAGHAIPVVFLSDHVDEVAVATALQAGAYDCLSTSGLSESSIRNAIRCAIDVYCKERQRLKAEDALRKLWRAVEQSADLVVITDRSGVIEYVNPAFEILTGYPREEAIGRTPRILKSGHQPASLYRELWQTILGGNVFRGVLINRKKNGETFFAEKTITPLRDAEGNITHFISNDRDITDRRRLEAQLQQAQKMDAIGRLAGGVAHDFNNLLMVISAYSELMLDALGGEHPLRPKAEEILGASRRAADLTRQLLAFSRKQMQALQLVDLNSVIQEICRMLPRLIGEDIQLLFVPGKDLGKVKTDPVQVEQVVMNLVVNARDAMPHGGKLTIETASVRLDEAYVQRHAIVPPGDYVLLAVSDSGEGIAPEHLSHIFEPFYTPKKKARALASVWPRCMGSSSKTADSSGCIASPDWEPRSKSTCRVCSIRVTSSKPVRPWRKLPAVPAPCCWWKMRRPCGSQRASF